MPAEMREDEGRLRVLRHQPIALPHQVLERRKPRAVEVPAVGKQRHLEPALVVVVERLEELRRIRGVDEHRNVEPRRRLPDRIELGIVQLQARSVGLAYGEAEALHDLAEAERAGLDVGFELRRRFRAETGTHIAKGDVGEHREPVLVAAGAERRQLLLQTLARGAARVHHHLEVDRIHRRRRRARWPPPR